MVDGWPKSYIPQHKFDEVAERISQCRLITISAGHNVHAIRPAVCANTILNWITNQLMFGLQGAQRDEVVGSA
jgi:hypothetical protein